MPPKDRDLEKYIEEARCYCNDDLEIDDHPATSESESGGVWVAAWIWVSDAEVDNDDDLD